MQPLVLSVLCLWLALSTISLVSCCSVASLELSWHSLLCQVFLFSPLSFAVYQSLMAFTTLRLVSLCFPSLQLAISSV